MRVAAAQGVQEGADDVVEAGGAALPVAVAPVGEDDGVNVAHVRAQFVGGDGRGLDDLDALGQCAAGPPPGAAGLGAHAQAARQRLLGDGAADLAGGSEIMRTVVMCSLRSRW